MIFSPRGVVFLQTLEGCDLHPYRDSAGVLTVGYGTVLSPKHPLYGKPINQDIANDLFRMKIGEINETLRLRIERSVMQCQYDSLVSFCYNVGTQRLITSTMLKRINQGDFVGAEEAMAWFDKITDPITKKKVVCPGLVNRRRCERKLFAGKLEGIPIDELPQEIEKIKSRKD